MLIAWKAPRWLGLRAEARFITGAAEGRWGIEPPESGSIRRWIARHAMSYVGAKALQELLPIAEELADPPRGS